VSKLDLKKLGRVIAMVGSSHDGEALTALRLADRMLRNAEMRWEDLLSPAHELEIATEAVAVLLAENTALKAEVEQLRTPGTMIATWSEVGAAISDTPRAAAWALELHRERKAWLTPPEIDFLTTVRDHWRGPLTPSQAPWFRSIMDRICTRTGLQPPS
jgi:hypothetical protein